MIIAIIHAVLFFIVLAVRQSRQYILFIPTEFFTHQYYQLVIGTSVAFLSSIAGTQMGPQTLLVPFLTLWYIECAIALTHGFFATLFEDSLPFEIRLFVSFVVMINAGYFTLMFIVSLLRAPGFHIVDRRGIYD